MVNEKEKQQHTHTQMQKGAQTARADDKQKFFYMNHLVPNTRKEQEKNERNGKRARRNNLADLREISNPSPEMSKW